jgi:hypothetical protein
MVNSQILALLIEQAQARIARNAFLYYDENGDFKRNVRSLLEEDAVNYRIIRMLEPILWGC